LHKIVRAIDNVLATWFGEAPAGRIQEVPKQLLAV
jgi:hypothetical protein